MRPFVESHKCRTHSEFFIRYENEQLAIENAVYTLDERRSDHIKAPAHRAGALLLSSATLGFAREEEPVFGVFLGLVVRFCTQLLRRSLWRFLSVLIS